VKNVPGRKTDVLDCQWLQQLHTYGLLHGAFRPADPVCALRAYLRQRDTLTRNAATHIQHMQKALAQMNLRVDAAVSDITGATGMRIIRAILDGERDPQVLAGYRDPRCKNSVQAIAAALEGNYRDEHLFALRQSVELWDFYGRQIAACDAAIERHLGTFETEVDPEQAPLPPSKKCRARNAPAFDLRTEMYRPPQTTPRRRRFFGQSASSLTECHNGESPTSMTNHLPLGVRAPRPVSLRHSCSWAWRRLGCCSGSRRTVTVFASLRTQPWHWTMA
jgi:hypothetical protein